MLGEGSERLLRVESAEAYIYSEAQVCWHISDYDIVNLNSVLSPFSRPFSLSNGCCTVQPGVHVDIAEEPQPPATCCERRGDFLSMSSPVKGPRIMSASTAVGAPGCHETTAARGS